MLSIITITKNNAKGLLETLTSVSDQIYTDFEMIVIDGHSVDGSADIVKNFKHLKIKFFLDDAKGIYPAMNQGIRKAEGDWILFLNAGDIFHDKHVLSHIQMDLDASYDFVFGKTIHPDGSEKFPYCDLKTPWARMPFCHQAVFNNRKVFQKMLFTEFYKITGDHDFYMRAIKKKLMFMQSPRVIAISDDDGISAQKIYRRVLESYVASFRSYPFVWQMHRHYWRKLKWARKKELRMKTGH